MFDYMKYLRTEHMPHIWCPGCGHGIILKSLIRSIDRLKWDKNNIVLISGIGCSSRSPGYMDFNTMHTTHGRALAFATGVKLANPKLKVIVVSGDGDAAAIGGNHFIHAARRNIDISLIVFNNYIYGMTGGQTSPTTPEGSIASTMQLGSIDPPFDLVNLAIGAGATFVARSTTAHPALLDNVIKKALTHKGFSVVDALSGCPTSYGRKNHQKLPVQMLKWFEDNTARLGKNSDDDLHKILLGVFKNQEKPEYTERYDQLREKIKKNFV